MKRIAIHIVLVILIMASCKKHDFTINNLNNGVIEILGHGGSGVSSLYPIDALESILNCLNKDSEGSEMDLQITSDNVIVLYHDELLESNTTGEGKIRDHTWAEIQEFRYAATPYSAYGISSLEMLIDAVGQSQDYRFSFDIKVNKSENESISQYIADFTNTLDSIIDQYNYESNVFIEAQNTDFLNAFQLLNPNVKLFYYPQEFQLGFDIAMSSGYDGITMSNDLITEADVVTAHNAGLQVIIWRTHNQKEHIDAIEKNPDIIETDNLDNLIKLLK